MVRAPCCEKMGLKKGPWTLDEDQILISYIQQHGHGNWRALPKQAGLLRCGKSCRLRWINYLRPDIKRGNFSREEEESIIKLHEQLGNRWSAIAARLPGRTDNEIKNVWHTHLKKRLKNYQSTQDSKGHSPKCDSNAPRQSEPEKSNIPNQPEINGPGYAPVSPQRSSSELSSVTDSSVMTNVTNSMVMMRHEQMEESSKTFPEIDESFWSDELSAVNSSIESDFSGATNELKFQFPSSPITTSMELESSSKVDDGMDFWYDLFIRAGDLPDLQEF